MQSASRCRFGLKIVKWVFRNISPVVSLFGNLKDGRGATMATTGRGGRGQSTASTSFTLQSTYDNATDTCTTSTSATPTPSSSSDGGQRANEEERQRRTALVGTPGTCRPRQASPTRLGEASSYFQDWPLQTQKVSNAHRQEASTGKERVLGSACRRERA